MRHALTLAFLFAATAAYAACGRTEPDPARPDGGTTDRDAVAPGVPDAEPTDAGPSSCAQPDETVLIDGDRSNVDLSSLLPGARAGDVVRVVVERGARVDSTSPNQAALTTGGLPLELRVCLVVEGEIVGHGGAGGSGGTGVTGSDARPCGRDGERGGDAVEFRTAGLIDVLAGGLIGGGGGGGGGAAGCQLNAGGGGGAGSPPGAGGDGSSGLDREPERDFCRDFGGALFGAAGEPGALELGGAGGMLGRGPGRVAGGRGGALGRPGEPGRSCFGAPGGEGGRGGFAIVLGSRPVEIVGEGSIAGAVDF